MITTYGIEVAVTRLFDPISRPRRLKFPLESVIKPKAERVYILDGYQCVLGGENCGGSAAQLFRILEYLEERPAGEVLNFVFPRFQLPVLEGGH